MNIVKKDDWIRKPFHSFKSYEYNKRLSMDEFNILKQGHIPDVMEDKWFIYCDEKSINYIRSWTGTQIYKGLYKIENNECLIYSLQINDNKKEYRPFSIYFSLGLFENLIDSMVSDSEERKCIFWDREQKLEKQISDGKITEAEADEMRKKYYKKSLQN